MNKLVTWFRVILLSVGAIYISAKFNAAFGQLIQYTNDTGGVLSLVAPHISADTLKRVNSGTRLSTPCTHGFSTRGFTNTTTYSDTLGAVQVKFGPDSGYVARVDSFVVDLRYSPTGPSKARYAYSLNGGTTWIDQGTDQLPHLSGTCDSMVTCRWATTILLTHTTRLMFRVYGFNASVTTGTGNLQIMNLNVYGIFPPSTSVAIPALDEQTIAVFPNPADKDFTVSYTISAESNVSVKVYNMIGQEVAEPVLAAKQQPGNYSFHVTGLATGLYYVRLNADGQTVTRKVVRY